MSEAGEKLKAAMELEQAGLESLLQEVESDGIDPLDFAKSLILVDRCTLLLLAMTVEGVGTNLTDVKNLAHQLIWHGFDFDALHKAKSDRQD